MKTMNILSLIFLSCSLIFSCQQPSSPDDEGDDRWIWNGNGSEKPSTKPEEGTVFYPKEKGVYRLVTYNVGALSKFMTNSTDMVAAMMNEIEADAVCINELDSCNTRHNVNQLSQLASALGNWKFYFGRAMAYKGGAYGNGVTVPKSMSIIDSYTVALPKGAGSEPRSIAVIETDKMVLGACHLDYTNEAAALDQAETVKQWVNSKYNRYDKPVFFMGDMNCIPGSAPIESLKMAFDVISSQEYTVPIVVPTKCIDFIFHYKKSSSVTVKGSHTMTKFVHGDATKASDHLPVYVDVTF